MMKTLLLLCTFFLASVCKAQLPETLIYLFDVQRSPRGYQLMNPTIIGKSKGYNNQPSFTIDGEYLFYVSSMDTSNTEIYRYTISKKKNRRMTKTAEAEYSPRFTPDMNAISCVRVEKDKTTQHFTAYNLKGKKPQVIMPKLKNVGYYEWLTQNEFLTFELPEPFYLVKHVISQNSSDTLAQNIGRTFYNLRNKSRLVFLDKTDSLHWKIKSISPEQLKAKRKNQLLETTVLTETLPGEEDFCFMQDGSILMGHEGRIYFKKNPFRFPQSPWDEWFDMSLFGIEKFSRLSISPDNTKLAVVVFKEKK